MMKVLYHNNCFDGICSAWVISKVYPDAEFIPCNYNDQNLMTSLMQDCYENANINDEYILVDFSLPRELMIAMSNKAMSMLVIDHHKTAEENCRGLDFCVFDMNESGASLAWKYFFPVKAMPTLVRYIKDRDLWLFKEPDSEAINSYIQSYPMTIEAYNELSEKLDDAKSFDFALGGGMMILLYKNQMVENICKNVAFTYDYPFYDVRVPIVNTSLLFSEVGHRLCELFPDAPFAAYYYDRLKDSKRQWGLRSIGEFDVSEVAKKNGGGGHKNAAGFETNLHDL